MKHDQSCEARPPYWACRCAKRTYLATATDAERAEFKKTNPDLSAQLRPPQAT